MANSYSGSSVSIDGNTVVVGAPLTRSAATPTKGRPTSSRRRRLDGHSGESAGSSLPPDGATNDDFGPSVSISGNTVVVGAPAATVGGNADQGAAYVFTAPAGGWTGTLNENAKLLASNGAAGDHFGSSVSVNGNTLVVGALTLYGSAATPGRGTAYVFTAARRRLDGHSE